MPEANVLLWFDMTDEQVERAAARAAELDKTNLGEALDVYTPSEAIARILASDDEIVPLIIRKYAEGWTAEEHPDHD